MINAEYHGKIYRVKTFAEMTPEERAETEAKIARIKARSVEIDKDVAAFRRALIEARIARSRQLS